MTRSFPDFTNPVKQRVVAGETALGMFFLSASNGLAEACGTTDLDWIAFDWEAGSLSKETLLSLMQSMRGSQTSAMVRVPFNHRHYIEHVLDLGADGIIVPKVDTAKEAREVVAAALFPPQGTRGLNPVRASGYFSDVPGYIKACNAKTLVLVQIESESAVRNVEEIVAVPGVDGVFVGCGDLALGLGVPAQMESPLMRDAIARILAACRSRNRVPGIFAYSVQNAREYLAMGYRFIAIGNDYKLLKQGVADTLHAVRAEG